MPGDARLPRGAPHAGPHLRNRPALCQQFRPRRRVDGCVMQATRQLALQRPSSSTEQRCTNKALTSVHSAAAQHPLVGCTHSCLFI